jgi:hypothetical protein
MAPAAVSDNISRATLVIGPGINITPYDVVYNGWLTATGTVTGWLAKT